MNFPRNVVSYRGKNERCARGLPNFKIMTPFQFNYNNQCHKGKVMISGSRSHGFFWCFLESDDLVREVGQCLIFSYSNGTLIPTKAYDPALEELVDAVREAVLPLYEEKNEVRRKW